MKRSLKAWFCIAGALVVPGLTGCGGSSSLTPTNPTPQPRSVSAALSDGLTATVMEDRTSVLVGGVVTYTLTLANNTALPITYQPVIGGATPSGGVPASLLVKDSQGNTAFPLGAMTAVIFIGPSTTLAPGQSVSGTLAVGDNKNLGQFPAAGRYTASTVFTVQTGQAPPGQNPPTVTATAGPLEVDAQ